MSVTMELEDLNIDPGSGITLDAVSWQINNSTDFSSSVLDESLNDTVNKSSYTVDLGSYESSALYGRVKLHLSSGDSNWSPIVLLDVEETDNIFSNTILMTPRVYTEGDANDIDCDKCVVATDDMRIFSGSGGHESTTWRIERTDNKLVWERKEDKDNLTSLHIPPNIMEDRRAYIIKARHHSSTGAESKFGAVLISTRSVTPV